MFVFSGRADRDHPLPTMTLPLLGLLYQLKSTIRQMHWFSARHRTSGSFFSGTFALRSVP
jgi:hypothetical protein